MPLNRFMILLIVVLAAAGLTVWVGGVVLGAFDVSSKAGLIAAIPVGLVAVVALRRIRGDF